jgi:hypothetical protein
MTHPFEAAGLGLAPFRFEGVEIRECSGQPNAQGISIGAPGQPAGTCADCSAGIKYCCRVRSADGKRFVVGTDCIERLEANDRPLVAAVNVEMNARKREAAAARRAAKAAKDDARIEAAKAALPAVREALAAKVHPHRPGASLADYVDWLFAHAGRSGQLRAATLVELGGWGRRGAGSAPGEPGI